MTPCGSCGGEHVTYRGQPSCTSHVIYDRDTYVKGQGRQKLDKPRPCHREPIRGLDVCATHGGLGARAKAAGQRRDAEARARAMVADALADAYGDDIPDVSPADAMLRAVSWTYAEVTVLRRKVAELSDDERIWGVTREKTGGDDRGTTEEAKPHIWWTMLRESMRDLVKFAAAARAAGCDEARVRLAEQQGKMLADVIRGILGDLRLTPEQEALVSSVVPRHLRAVAG